jgi:hypothetical protein
MCFLQQYEALAMQDKHRYFHEKKRWNEERQKQASQIIPNPTTLQGNLKEKQNSQQPNDLQQNENDHQGPSHNQHPTVHYLNFFFL